MAWSMAGLFGTSAMVLMPPPLSASPTGLRPGAVLRLSPLPSRKPPGSVEASPPAASLLIFAPREVMRTVTGPEPPVLTRFAPVAPLRKMLLRKVVTALAGALPKVDAPLLIAPPVGELLALKVQ